MKTSIKKRILRPFYFFIFCFKTVYQQGIQLIEKFSEIFENIQRPWHSVEKKLLRNLQRNMFYPFASNIYNDFSCEWRSIMFYYGIATAIISTIVFIVSNVYNLRTNIVDMVNLFALCWSIRNIIFYAPMRKVVISSFDAMYSFYIGDSLISKSHFHNIYIRLVSQMNSNGVMNYWLILGGYKIEQFWITGITKDPSVIEKIGKKIAHRVNLNFFHSEDTSNRHVIRHLNPKKFLKYGKSR